jgi:hypothetical protein
MVKTLLRGLAPAALCAAILAAHAQTPPPTGRRDPLDASAGVPPLVYRSSLVPSRSADADKPITWREANDTVTRIGGWRTYAREAQEPVPAQTAPSPAASASTPNGTAKPIAKPMPMPPGHSGHKTP